MRERGDVYGVVIIASRGRMKETARSIDAATSLQAAERERERARSSELGRAGESWSLITAVASRRQFDRVLCRSLNDVAAGSIATHTQQQQRCPVKSPLPKLPQLFASQNDRHLLQSITAVGTVYGKCHKTVGCPSVRPSVPSTDSGSGGRRLCCRGWARVRSTCNNHTSVIRMRMIRAVGNAAPNSVYVTVRCPSVRPSACPVDR